MAACKYFQQGENSTLGNKPSHAGIKTVACTVAEEVLAVERGGQWLLSCFGPFKERPCIPGMEDLSPDEFHWEMYQAQKSGTVDQTKLQFQQLCQEMQGKFALLKNPTAEIVAMLESLQKGGQENAFGASSSSTEASNFSFASPQLAIPSTSASASNLFTSKPFNTPNPFGGNSFGSSGSTPFAFSNPSNTSISSPFGAKPTFGTNPAFGGATNPSLPFGGTGQSLPLTFNRANQNAASFGSPTPQNVSPFTAQPTFGQSPGFNISTQENNSPFGRLQSTQSNAIFGGTTTSTSSIFGGAAAAQPSPSIFGGAQPTATPLFGGTTTQTPSSIFGGSTATGNTPLGSVASPFSQPKTNMAFGGGPVFGGAPTFSAQANPGMFGGQSTFGSVPTSSSNIFGGTNPVTPTFGSIGQSAPGSFSSAVKSPTSNFGGATNPLPFGSPVSAANTGPFGTAVSTTSSPFVTSTGPFNTAAAASTPFSGSNPFGSMGQTVDATAGFGATPTPSTTPFGTANVADPSPFSQASPFGAAANSSPFSTTQTTATTTTANPFATQTPIVSSSPFGGTGLSHQGSIFTSSQSTPFSNSPFASVNKETEMLDDNAYTMEGNLTDDEKAMYMAKQFTLGKIPLKAPTKELR